MRALAAAVALVIVSSAAASANPVGDRRFFPLRVANEWTFEDTSFGGDASMRVAQGQAGVFRLAGFPGAGELRVRYSGATLQAWDQRQRRWEALLRLGATAGTAYQVDLPAPSWSGARVTVSSRRATAANPVLRRSYKGALRFAVRPPAGLSDAGVTDLWFAPRIGLVRWVEQSFTGPRVHVLSRARLGS